MKKLFTILITVLMALSLTACTNNENGDITATCYNGKFVGAYEQETGVLSFKGIPYAKAPVGERRWKAPESVDASDKTYSADEFGYSAVQYNWFSEDIETEVSEDCLTLNIWTSDLKGSDKPVMVFFHGGSYAWGGTSESLYNGQYIVNKHEDVIVVTCNYRIGIMGFIDFSNVPGGEEYSDSIQLGLLDALESLRWIKNNIENFGGNPDNITIFGESAGGGLVSCLLASEYAGELFNRVIVESGTLNQTQSVEEGSSNNQAEILMELSGAENMADLVAISEEELIEYNEYPLDEYETCLNDLYSIPFTGGVVADDPYKAIENAKAKGVDLLIGTNADEANYWINEVNGAYLDGLSDEEIEECIDYYEEVFLDSQIELLLSKLTEDGIQDVEEYMSLFSDELQAKQNVVTEFLFKAASIRVAECYSDAEGTGKTYMYLFDKGHSDFECIGACHAIELPYVFHNLEYSVSGGAIDEQLADKICEAWVNFAKNGDPSIDGFTWQEYDTTNRYTLLVNEDGLFEMVSDPNSKQRILAECIGYTNLSGMNGV